MRVRGLLVVNAVLMATFMCIAMAQAQTGTGATAGKETVLHPKDLEAKI